MSTTRDRLLRAATETFSVKGFHATTMRDIAGAAGVTSGAVYVHFESKEDLLFQVSKLGHSGAVAAVTTAATGSDSPTERLSAAVSALSLWHAEHRTRARVVNYELVALTEPHRREIQGLRRTIFDSVSSLLEEGIALGDFDSIDHKQATLQILSLCVDISRWFDASKSWTPSDVAEMTSRAAVRLVSRPHGGSGIR